jgi:hypothetical protein
MTIRAALFVEDRSETLARIVDFLESRPIRIVSRLVYESVGLVVEARWSFLGRC